MSQGLAELNDLSSEGFSNMVKAFWTKGLEGQEATSIRTTLYDLSETICEEVPPEEDWVVSQVVLHLLKIGQIKFFEHSEDFEAPGA